MEAHPAQPVEQAAGVFEHDPRPRAFSDELRNEFAHPLVAPVEDGGIVVVSHMGMLHHVLQIADQAGRVQVLAASGDQRLVHVERIGEAATDRAEVDAAFVQVREVCRLEAHWSRATRCRRDSASRPRIRAA